MAMKSMAPTQLQIPMDPPGKAAVSSASSDTNGISGASGRRLSASGILHARRLSALVASSATTEQQQPDEPHAEQQQTEPQQSQPPLPQLQIADATRPGGLYGAGRRTPLAAAFLPLARALSASSLVARTPSAPPAVALIVPPPTPSTPSTNFDNRLNLESKETKETKETMEALLLRLLPPPAAYAVAAFVARAAAFARTAASSTHAEAAVWLAVYFSFNLSLTIYNKAIMQFYRFPFPWTLTGIHTLCGALGCRIMAAAGFFRPATLSMRENAVMVAFSALYTVNIAVSNVSLGMVSVPFHQTVRAMVPLFTMAIELCCFQKTFAPSIVITMIPIIAGVSLATIGDYSFTTLGLLLTLLGTCLAAIKGIITNRVQVGKLRLHPLDLLLRMSPLACIQTMLYAFTTGELSKVVAFSNDGMSTAMIIVLLINGSIAFGLNVSSFTANKMTSALTMGVAGNIKQVLSIILAVAIFNISVSVLNGVGIVLTLIGGALYTRAEIAERRRSRSPIIVVPPHDMEPLFDKPVNTTTTTASSSSYIPINKNPNTNTNLTNTLYTSPLTSTAIDSTSPIQSRSAYIKIPSSASFSKSPTSTPLAYGHTTSA